MYKLIVTQMSAIGYSVGVAISHFFFSNLGLQVFEQKYSLDSVFVIKAACLISALPGNIYRLYQQLYILCENNAFNDKSPSITEQGNCHII